MDDLSIFSSCEVKTENYKSYDRMAVKLVSSLRINGGIYKNSPIILGYNVNRKPSDDIISQLTAYGCKIVQINYTLNNLSIKPEILCLPSDTKYKMWLDTDIYIMSDFSDLIEEMKRNDYDIAVAPTTFSHHKWARKEDTQALKDIYNSFSISLPEKRLFVT